MFRKTTNKLQYVIKYGDGKNNNTSILLMRIIKNNELGTWETPNLNTQIRELGFFKICECCFWEKGGRLVLTEELRFNVSF